MPKLYRDATTGQYTTAEDAAARPAETVAETVEARHETPDVAELRRLLAGAWDEGGDFVTRHPGMSAEYVRAANPYRQTEGNRA